MANRCGTCGRSVLLDKFCGPCWRGEHRPSGERCNACDYWIDEHFPSCPGGHIVFDPVAKVTRVGSGVMRDASRQNAKLQEQRGLAGTPIAPLVQRTPEWEREIARLEKAAADALTVVTRERDESQIENKRLDERLEEVQRQRVNEHAQRHHIDVRQVLCSHEKWECLDYSDRGRCTSCGYETSGEAIATYHRRSPAGEASKLADICGQLRALLFEEVGRKRFEELRANNRDALR